MALLNNVFNASEIEPAEARDFSAIPPGPQTVNIINSEMRNIKPKDGQDPDGYYGQYLWLEMEIMEGQYERRKHWEMLSLEHEKPEVVQIANRNLAAICLACGKTSIKDSEELHGIPFIAEFEVTQDRRNNPKPPRQPPNPPFPPVNRVKAYRSLNGATPSQPQRMGAPVGNGAYAGGTGNGAGSSGGFPPPDRAPNSGGAGLPWGKK